MPKVTIDIKMDEYQSWHSERELHWLDFRAVVRQIEDLLDLQEFRHPKPK